MEVLKVYFERYTKDYGKKQEKEKNRITQPDISSIFQLFIGFNCVSVYVVDIGGTSLLQ
ncbi:MAG: hypothetical protein J5988_15225 [Eubacterium sp.]|nr:hypothetical protein [Eubacterium sp.]